MKNEKIECDEPGCKLIVAERAANGDIWIRHGKHLTIISPPHTVTVEEPPEE